MHIYRDAVVLMPTKEDHDKFAAFVEAYSDIRWRTGVTLSRQCLANYQEAYLIEGGRVSHADVPWFHDEYENYPEAVANNLFLVTVDEYIARCLGWDDVESEINFDFGDVL